SSPMTAPPSGSRRRIAASWGPVEAFRYARCGTSAAPRATHDAHGRGPASLSRAPRCIHGCTTSVGPTMPQRTPRLFRMPKPAGYYGLERADLVAELPRPLGRVLDVGCGEGGVGRSLRAAGATEVHGIEVVPTAAAVARDTLDGLYEGTVEAALLSDELG